MKSITLLLAALCLLFCYVPIRAQVSHTANDEVTPYDGKFRPGMNLQYAPPWNNFQLGELAAGKPSIGLLGVGSKTVRINLPEYNTDYYGTGYYLPELTYYNGLGMSELTSIVGDPSGAHRDYSQFCPGEWSSLFDNLYEPIWDGGLNGTPYNDENYFAAYLYEVVKTYKDHVRFWEIWNEPGFDLTGNLGWRDPDYPGNWWTNNPQPCDYILRAPIFHYVRVLRIAWEVIKTADPDAYVMTSGHGFASFLDAVLRNTDNPVDGSVTDEYPLKGGAYFDCYGFHSYPHFDGSTENETLNFFERHSDAAADGVLGKKYDYFGPVLANYGYDGSPYPEKEWAVTEINVPREDYTEPYFHGDIEQVNFIIKAFINCKIHKIHQMHVFSIADRETEGAADYEFDLMGVYKKIEGAQPYNQTVNSEGKALKTATDFLYETTYDPVRTAALNVPSGVRGKAFVQPDGKYVYVMWAETHDDFSEAVQADYNFPASFNLTSLKKHLWDNAYNAAVETISPTGIKLNATPIFLTESEIAPPPPPAGNYCASTSAFPWHEWIAGVKFGSIDHVSSKTAYSDFTNTSTQAAAGATLPITLTTGYSFFTFNENWKVWIDFDHDGTFEEPGELVFQSLLTAPANGTSTAAVNGSVSIPADALTGNTRMRISMKRGAAPTPCETLPQGEVEDYTVHITGGGGTGGGGSSANCASESAFPWYEWIAKVQFGGINNASSKKKYSDFTAINANAQKGSTLDLALTTGFSYFTFNEYWKAWIDYDLDGIFEEPGELVFQGIKNAPPNGTLETTLNGSVSIPVSASTGAARMRVSMKRGAYPSPCETLPQGEVEDYTVNITPSIADDSDTEERSEAVAFQFHALKNQGLAELFFVVPNVEEFDVFEIEKRTAGTSFRLLTKLPRDATRYYSAIDGNPVEGANFYRLKLRRADGTAVFSEVKELIFNDLTYGVLSPNPATTETFVGLKSWMGKPLTIEIANVYGQVVFSETLAEVKAPRHRLGVSGLPGGQYFVSFKSAKRRIMTQKLVVLR